MWLFFEITGLLTAALSGCTVAKWIQLLGEVCCFAGMGF
ncbi:CD6 isoform 2 [Pan troglodytes]|uniref:CD6 isoform 2 n=1 Tax=Pan troglodytes TaxID=9598 RepID=A0A2J8LCZ3_PANTR|nr:CD6 isoform 2 [Pan troglodytes]